MSVEKGLGYIEQAIVELSELRDMIDTSKMNNLYVYNKLGDALEVLYDTKDSIEHDEFLKVAA